MKTVYISLLIFTMLITFGCEQVLEPEPRGQIELDQLLNTEEGYVSVLNGAYEPLASGGIYDGLFWRNAELASDDGWTWRNEQDPDLYRIAPTSELIFPLWSEHYRGIARTNVILSRIDEAQFNNSDLKEAIQGQAHFLRALYYFNLVRLFGGIPLFDQEVTSREESEAPRTDIEAVYNQIQTDLDEAVNLLPVAYNGGSGFEKGRATRYTALALSAMVHLELEEWTEAAQDAQEIISSGQFELHANFGDNFYGLSENGVESLFEVQFGGVGGGTNANHSSTLAPPALAGGAAFILPTDDSNDFGTASTGGAIVQEFEDGDLRRDVTLANYGLDNFLDPTKATGSLFYVNKFFAGDQFPSGQSPYNFPIIRYAEVLLIAAEALNEAGTDNSNVIEYLNMIRNRAGLADLSAEVTGNQSALREEIRRQRRLELAYEGKRYFDLNRWGILEETQAVQGVTVPAERTITHPITGKSYFLYPLPATEFINNANLGNQNPGY
jgi:hypothetical protein